MNTTIAVMIVIVAVTLGIASGRAAGARNRELLAAIKSGKPSAILIVLSVAAYAAYVVSSYQPPQ